MKEDKPGFPIYTSVTIFKEARTQIRYGHCILVITDDNRILAYQIPVRSFNPEVVDLPDIG
jgi:hypothetical protein